MTNEYRVPCLRDPWQHKTIYILWENHPDGKPIGFCNGCEDMSGHAACDDCIAKYTALFNRGELSSTQEH